MVWAYLLVVYAGLALLGAYLMVRASQPGMGVVLFYVFAVLLHRANRRW